MRKQYTDRLERLKGHAGLRGPQPDSQRVLFREHWMRRKFILSPFSKSGQLGSAKDVHIDNLNSRT
jgi:hypothetical protein